MRDCPQCLDLLYGADIDMKTLIAQARREGAARLCADCRTRGADDDGSGGGGVSLAGITNLVTASNTPLSQLATITSNLANPNLGQNIGAIGGVIGQAKGAAAGVASGAVAQASTTAKDLLWEAGAIFLVIMVIGLILWRKTTVSH